jgi:peptidoglycan/xylan/chitin deacetylase (PgdA/CDA1 family)
VIPRFRVPVLMYHEIADPSESRSRLAVSPDAFAAQLDCLADGGFETMTAAALSRMLRQGDGELPERTIVLTFDDGYEDFHSRAMPLLSQHGFTATLFLTSGWVQDAGSESAGKRPTGMLSWDQVTAAARAGIEIAAHTCWHPQLDQLPENLVREELCTSKATLEERLGVPVPGLAYPFGYSNATVRRVAREAGYAYGFAVGNRIASSSSDMFALERLTVRHATSLSAFRKLVHGHDTMGLRQDRALTKGWALMRRSKAALNTVGRNARGVVRARACASAGERTDT